MFPSSPTLHVIFFIGVGSNVWAYSQTGWVPWPDFLPVHASWLSIETHFKKT